jgi:3-phenylpropionate/trans-cinnamate dioxygenase ferredoxin subunit
MDPVTITVRENGPFVIAGDDMARVRLVDHQGNEIPTAGRARISLCRCGASTKKPFCDGTHSRIGFQGAEAAQVAYDAGRAAERTGDAPASAPPPAPAAPADGSSPGT